MRAPIDPGVTRDVTSLAGGAEEGVVSAGITRDVTSLAGGAEEGVGSAGITRDVTSLAGGAEEGAASPGGAREEVSPGRWGAATACVTGSVLSTGAEASTVEAAFGGPESRAGRVIAGRYTLSGRLGTGAFGEVWIAEDRVLRRTVALKWLRRAAGPSPSRVRREITTLRLLQVPGVVRLLDEGIEDERPFLVMERVEGSPFPGRRDRPVEWGPAQRWTWAEIAAPAIGLLEVLARVHAAGVVHRDLKPDNVLVSDEGRPTVLDFGISHMELGDDGLTAAGQILGTPRYLAPEQLLGEAVDGRADLYAVGVMLYRALTSALPHEAPDLPSMLRARLTLPARPIRELAGDLPIAVARGIDRMLALRREDRPRSAAEALAALRGEAPGLTGGPALPRLGGDGPVRAVVSAVRAGASVDVVGAAGTGRTRCLEDVGAALSAEGRRVLSVSPSRAPLASLRPLLGAPEGHAALGIGELSDWMAERLQELLRSGAVLLVDDAERLDRWSSAVLARGVPGPGAIVTARLAGDVGSRADNHAVDVGSRADRHTGEVGSRADRHAEEGSRSDRHAGEVGSRADSRAVDVGSRVGGSARVVEVRLQALDEEALRPLFAGPDRLFHLREDAARALWERTEGAPLRVDAEVTLWLRLGLARRDGDRLVVERDALHRLSAGLPGASLFASGSSASAGEPHEDDLLGWLALAGRHLPIRDLARAIEQPVWLVEAVCDALVERGAARRLGGGRVEPRGHVGGLWSSARVIEAHRAIASALRPGDEGRLFHLLAADDALAAAEEALVVAGRHASERGLGEAIAALSEGARALRSADGEAARRLEVLLLAELTKMAFAQGTEGALDAVLYEISRARVAGPDVDRLAALVRIGLAAPGAGGLLAIEAADDLRPFDDPGLERRRQRARITAAAARVSPDLLDAVLDDVADWAAHTQHPIARLCLAEGRALLRYQEGRFEEAAALHAEAAELDPWLVGRIAATLNAGSAMLEAFRHREAESCAGTALALARYCRQPYWEARAEWLSRSARYRMGEATFVDHELCAAVAKVGMPNVDALVCLNEAAVAMRLGALSEGAELADRAARIWSDMARTWSALLARGLAIACGSPVDRGEAREIAARALGCRLPGVAVQILACLARAGHRDPRWREASAALSEGVPEAMRDRRMDLLTMNEALSEALDLR